MISQLYGFLARVGYSHPIHPPLTHLPIGLVLVVFLSVLWGAVFGRHLLQPRCCYRISLVALVFLVPTVLTGYTDWRHFYDGAWLFEIKVKYALTAVLLVTLSIGALAGYAQEPRSKRNFLVYLLAFLAVVGLGYFGSQLVLQDVSSEAPKAFRQGERLFSKHCGECHGAAELVDSPYAGSVEELVRFVRDPAKVGGKPLPMPAFAETALPAAAVKQILDFVRVSGCVEQVKAR
jgi:mono/diheme cytochrome c family protein